MSSPRPELGELSAQKWAFELRNYPEMLKTNRALEHLRGPEGFRRSRLIQHCSNPSPESKHAFGL